jgi:thymidylate kinase
VLRNYEGFPATAGFDLDVLVDDAALSACVKAGCTAAEEHGLVPCVQRKRTSVKIALFLPVHDRAHRQWLLLDLQTAVRGPKEERFRAGDIAVERRCVGDLWLPVPNSEWRVLLAAIQAARKQHLSPELRTCILDELARNPQGRLAQGLRDSARILTGAAAADDTAWLDVLTNTLGVAPYHAQPPRPRRWRTRLSRFVFFRLLFFHHHRPPFLVVSGADGVGKSTLIRNVVDILSSYPLEVRHFHHTDLSKDPAWETRAVGDQGNADARPARSLGYRIARALWRSLVPPAAKLALTAIIGELRYARRLNLAVGRDFYAGRLTLSDRYVYDRAVKMNMLPKPAVQKWAARANCRIMRPPRLTLVLTDEPVNIRARKQELSLEEIEQYQGDLLATCRRVGAPCYELPVDGRPAEALVAEVTTALLMAAGSDVVAAVGVWERKHPKAVGEANKWCR